MNSNETPSETKNEVTPEQAIERLKEGNTRFISGVRSVEPLLSHLKMKELSEKGQKPFAIVLTCSDSRSPAEMIFDQGIGELFVIRVAGNVVAPSLLASIEFAAANFGCSVVVVLGHTQCGAIKATVEHAKNPVEPLPSVHLEELIGRITPALERTLRMAKLTDTNIVQLSTIENVKRSMRLVAEQSHIVRDLTNAGKLTVVGAILDISNGQVDFFD